MDRYARWSSADLVNSECWNVVPRIAAHPMSRAAESKHQAQAAMIAAKHKVEYCWDPFHETSSANASDH